MPVLSLIVAMTRDRVIGRDNDLPWRLSEDLKRFKRITTGKPIIMGRKTYDSIGRPLPNRLNIVVTRSAEFKAPGCTVVHSLDDALAAAGDVEEVLVIGGATLYEEALPRADRLYLTWVEADVAGDTFFPTFDVSGWRVEEDMQLPADEKNEHPTTYQVLARS
jgi:dihydrofolate reductase